MIGVSLYQAHFFFCIDFTYYCYYFPHKRDPICANAFAYSLSLVTILRGIESSYTYYWLE